MYEGAPNIRGTAVDVARQLPREAVSWYIYCSITHAYSDGASGQALWGDLIRFYSEETGEKAVEHVREVPEQFALLQRRLPSRWSVGCQVSRIPTMMCTTRSSIVEL